MDSIVEAMKDFFEMKEDKLESQATISSQKSFQSKMKRTRKVKESKREEFSFSRVNSNVELTDDEKPEFCKLHRMCCNTMELISKHKKKNIKYKDLMSAKYTTYCKIEQNTMN